MSNECTALLAMTAAGAVLGVLFDFLRAVRISCGAGRILTAVTDVAFWIGAAAIVWGVLLHFCNAMVRGFEIFGLFMGAVLYHMLFAKAIREIFEGIFKLFFKILLTPAHFLYKIIHSR